MYEAVNFAAFLGDSKKMQVIARRIHDEAVRLKVKEVAIVECGTAFRAMKYMTGAHPFKVVAFVELISRYLREGRIQLRKDTLQGTLTYHDPCQIARNGGVIEEPRHVIRHLTGDFVELRPNRAENWCCGGGGGPGRPGRAGVPDEVVEGEGGADEGLPGGHHHAPPARTATRSSLTSTSTTVWG